MTMIINWYSKINILFMFCCIVASIVYFILWRNKSRLFELFTVGFIFQHEAIKLYAILQWYANWVECHVLSVDEMVLAERLYTFLENEFSIMAFIYLIVLIKSMPKDNFKGNIKYIMSHCKNELTGDKKSATTKKRSK